MTIKCSKCNTEIKINEDQFGKPCKCPSCSAILILPRLKGSSGGSDVPLVEALPFEDVKQELLEALREDIDAFLQAKVTPATEDVVQKVAEAVKPDIEKWASARASAAAAGIDLEALREQLRDDIIEEVRKEVAAVKTPAGNDVSGELITKLLETIGTRLGPVPATPGADLAPASPDGARERS